MTKLIKEWYNGLSDGDKYFLGMILWSILTGLLVIAVDRNYNGDYILNVSNARYYPKVTDKSIRQTINKMERMISEKDEIATETRKATDVYDY